MGENDVQPGNIAYQSDFLCEIHAFFYKLKSLKTPDGFIGKVNIDPGTEF